MVEIPGIPGVAEVQPTEQPWHIRHRLEVVIARLSYHGSLLQGPWQSPTWQGPSTGISTAGFPIPVRRIPPSLRSPDPPASPARERTGRPTAAACPGGMSRAGGRRVLGPVQRPIRPRPTRFPDPTQRDSRRPGPFGPHRQQFGPATARIAVFSISTGNARPPFRLPEPTITGCKCRAFRSCLRACIPVFSTPNPLLFPHRLYLTGCTAFAIS